MAKTTQQVPETNRTTLGLYVTGVQAYEMWKADPDNVNILDVRTFEEYVFGGHAEMAKNIPLLFPKFIRPREGEAPAAAIPGKPPGCAGELNPEFIATVKAAYAASDTILVMCATGGRAAVAVNMLAKAGFTKVYNIINGFEGDRVTDEGSVYFGKNMRNGWKNLGLPWGYNFHPDLMWEEAPKEVAAV
jgi:rhodanese-related sulfurtransferase